MLLEKGYPWSPFVHISSIDIHLSQSGYTKKMKRIIASADSLFPKGLSLSSPRIGPFNMFRFREGLKSQSPALPMISTPIS